MRTVCVIVPTYGALDYAVRAVASLMQTCRTLEPHALIIDDATPEMQPRDDKRWDAIFGALQKRYTAGGTSCVQVIKKDVNGGLTSCWNLGLRVARHFDFDYAVCGNSDILFTPGWDKPLTEALDRGLSLVGPITNAPGSAKRQDVAAFLPDYLLTDDEGYLAETAAKLYAAHGSAYYLAPINGFFMMAKTLVWCDNAYDQTNVFKPRNDFNSSGQRNLTPLMTLNEDELIGRWQAKGLLTGFCPGSLIFHYRAVSRGNKYKRGKWYRRKEQS